MPEHIYLVGSHNRYVLVRATDEDDARGKSNRWLGSTRDPYSVFLIDDTPNELDDIQIINGLRVADHA